MFIKTVDIILIIYNFLPAQHKLINHPNVKSDEGNPVTTIRFSLPEKSPVYINAG